MQNNFVQEPKFPHDIITKLQTFEVSDKKSVSKNLDFCVGSVAAETVVPYPPGIPLFVKGELIQKEHITYIKALKKSQGLMDIIMSDKDKKTIKVVN